MILQSLVKYYEALERKGKIPKPGWSIAKVSFALEITEDGILRGIIPLESEQPQGKKVVKRPYPLKVPQMVSRTVGVAANFLCDNSSYLLGIDKKGNPERSIECFMAAKIKHLEILKNTDGKAARAVKNFFEKWEPKLALENTVLAEWLDNIISGYNLIFCLNGTYIQEDKEVKTAWDAYLGQASSETKGICLVTGERTEIARIHSTIKGVQGAQSSGAALVSFNAGAFESYGKEQSYNAPVGTYAAYAYTTALNALLSDQKHTALIGDTTVVFWSEEGEEEYQDAFCWMAEPTVDNQDLIAGIFQNLESKKAVNIPWFEKNLDLEQPFYILGLAPNSARLSVRFFYQNSFGTILQHLKEHYDNLEIIKSYKDPVQYLGIWRLLQETVNKKNKDKKPAPNMAGAVYRAMITGGRYPDALYQGVLRRIRADNDDSDKGIYKITRGRAAIIKAYLIKNGHCNKEDFTMALNENCNHNAYILGREFAVLEAIQEDASGDINATIKDRYFNAACATPASIFPVLFKLKNSHIRKIKDTGKVIYYEKLLGELQDKLMVSEIGMACPRRLSLEEQGLFILGYYHQTQKRFEKKHKEEV